MYGDTDSIMVSTGTNDVADSRQIAEEIKEKVNNLYRTLEIELDGVFKTLLLLKKKKYAALMYNNPYDEKEGWKQEVKGLDMVRRDWCPLSKSIGESVLSELLSGKNREEIECNLRTYFQSIAMRLKDGAIPLS